MLPGLPEPDQRALPFDQLKKRLASSGKDPKPVFILKELGNINKLRSMSMELAQRQGIYAFINRVNGKQYVGSSIDLRKRLLEHIMGVKSNIRLQSAFRHPKYGLNNFTFVVYEFYDASVTSGYELTDLETAYLQWFIYDPSGSVKAKNMLYNFKTLATSMLGYVHTESARAKMRARFVIKSNHPMWGKKHRPESLLLISKPGVLNPMFGKTHTDATKALLSEKKSKFVVSMFDKDYQLLQSFSNNVELARHLDCHKGTIGRYITSQKLYKGLYYFKKEPKQS